MIYFKNALDAETFASKKDHYKVVINNGRYAVIVLW